MSDEPCACGVDIEFDTAVKAILQIPSCYLRSGKTSVNQRGTEPKFLRLGYGWSPDSRQSSKSFSGFPLWPTKRQPSLYPVRGPRVIQSRRPAKKRPA